jgi:hypothetical protein
MQDLVVQELQSLKSPKIFRSYLVVSISLHSPS